MLAKIEDNPSFTLTQISVKTWVAFNICINPYYILCANHKALGFDTTN